jgi:hypothetical protein
VKLDRKLPLSLAALAALLLLALSYLPAASAQSSTTSTATVSTGTNIPAPTGCTAPGYLAPASLLTTLGSNKSVSNGFTLGNPPKSDRPYEYLFLAGGALLALLILVGIVWAVVILATRGRRRNDQAGSAPAKRSHAGRNAYLALLLITIVVTGSAGYVLSPYLVPHAKVEIEPNGMVQNIASPYNQIQLDPTSIKYFYVPAYVNGESTLLEGNFTVSSGGPVTVVVVPDSMRPAFFADLQNGTFTGVSGCTMAGMSVYYDSGPATSGAFAVEIPPVTNQTTYDAIFANPSANQTITLTANVFWAY